MREMKEIILYGTLWCGGSRRTRQLLDRAEIPYQFVDIDQDEAARRIVETINHGYRSVPTLVFPDGTTLTEPTEEVLSLKLGVKI